MKSLELRQKRAGLIAEARTILDRVDEEKREIAADEQTRWDALIRDAEQMMTVITRIETQEKLERDLGSALSGGLRPEPQQAAPDGAVRRGRTSEEYRQAFASYLRQGITGLNMAEMRALQADSDTLGGYLVAPTQFVQGIIKAMDNLTFIRQMATKYQVANAESLGAASLDTDVADATWTTELVTNSFDSAMAFGRRELHPHILTKGLKISRKLLGKVPDVEALVRDRLAYKFGVTMEKAYLTGIGAGQPLGVFVASNDGIPTGRDYSTGNSATAMAFDGLIGAKYTLKQQYWAKAAWLLHRDGAAQIAKLKDSDGQYIWRESVRVGEPDRLLGFPMYLSEYAPNTFTASQYVGILGDFSAYWIADSLGFEVQRLVELYAESNQIGLIARMETDGMPVLAEAFVRVKLAAS